jgi:hypothetical protein
MSKPLIKEQIQLKKFRRLSDKSLEQLLLHRFLNNYGYDRGEITAKAIINDILQLIDHYFLVTSIDDDLHHINYGQLVWMAVPVDEFPQRSKSIAKTRLKPVVLSFINDQDISHIAHGFDSKSLRKNRLSRWVDQAFDQGALLTQLDLAVLLGVCDAVVSQYVQEIQTEGHLLPTRGNIHDLSGGLLLIKEKSLLCICKVTLLPILPLKLITLKKLSTVTSKIITESRFFGRMILKTRIKYLISPDYLNVLFNSILICCQLN